MKNLETRVFHENHCIKTARQGHPRPKSTAGSKKDSRRHRTSRGFTFFFILCLFLPAAVLPTAPSRAAEAPEIDIGRMERRVLDIVNEERSRRDLPMLTWNSQLAGAARSHSLYLADQNRGKRGDLYLSHEGPSGDHFNRLHQGGFYDFSASGENIFGIHRVKMYRREGRVTRPVAFHGERDMVVTARDGWMRSPGHKKNILDGDFDESGVGIAADPTGTVFIITQVFIRRARCGYVTGPCCEKEGYLPHCYVPLECRGGVCR